MPRLPLLIAALVLPIAVVLLGFALTEGPRTPRVPPAVRVGVAPGPPVTGSISPARPPVAELPPPRPDDDDEDDDRDEPGDG